MQTDYAFINCACSCGLNPPRATRCSITKAPEQCTSLQLIFALRLVELKHDQTTACNYYTQTILKLNIGMKVHVVVCVDTDAVACRNSKGHVMLHHTSVPTV